MERSVADAAADLGVAEVRVRQMLQSGRLAGRKVGRQWLIDSSEIQRAVAHRAPSGRPLAARLAWGVLDLLDDGSAPWLDRADRSRARVHARNLAGADAGRWRAALRNRQKRMDCRAHPAALQRLYDAPGVVQVGPAVAAAAGVDLVALDVVPEVYVPEWAWPGIARRLAIRQNVAASDANLVVHVPEGAWPVPDVVGPPRPGLALLAADLLDSPEPRAISGGVDALNRLASHLPASRRRVKA